MTEQQVIGGRAPSADQLATSPTRMYVCGADAPTPAPRCPPHRAVGTRLHGQDQCYADPTHRVSAWHVTTTCRGPPAPRQGGSTVTSRKPHRRRLGAAASVAVLAGAAFAAVLGPSPASAAPPHVANPFVGATQYLSPDYTAEVNAQAAADGGTLGTAEATVANSPTAVWMDRIAAITGDSVHHGLQFHLDHALAQQQGTTPETIEIVIYDLPGRDCAALASNGEIPATSAGLTQYESQYIDPIVALEGNSKYSNLRI